ncbi:MAG: ABC transporter permease [Candidatus Dormibacteraeota bacterium]|nr:ABC transporter permease [Candidatus Dormibacteraeota bacterium]
MISTATATGNSRALRALLPRVLGVAILLGLWQLLAVAGVSSPAGARLPGPGDALAEIVTLTRQGVLLPALLRTLSRAAIGYVLALAVGTAVGLAAARIPLLRAAVGSLLAGLQSLPSVVWAPIATIFFVAGGHDENAMYFVVIMGAFPSIAMGVLSAYDHIPPLTFRLARSLGARGPQLYRHFVISAALPGYVAGMRQAWAFSWRSLMAAELIIGSLAASGIGQLLDNGRSNLDLPEMFAAVLVILVVGVAVDDLLFTPLERGLLRRRGLLPAA